MISAADLSRAARRRAGLTQRELARRAKIPQPTIAAIESGRQEPRYATISRLLRACGVALDFGPVLGEGLDRSLIREQLRLTPGQRLRLAAREARFLATLDDARLV
ncbi:MAG: helix-turn-helix domain-containing protein [Candidatus Limnocylindria bacterium]